MNRLLSPSQQNWIADRCERVLADILRDAWALGVSTFRGDRGERIVDCGLTTSGSWEVGRRLTELCQGGLATACLGLRPFAGEVLPELVVESYRPAMSAYGLQVSLPLDEIDPAIRVSGPVLARFPDARVSIDRDAEQDEAWGIAIVETHRADGKIADAIAARSGLSADRLTLLLVPIDSVAGSTQLAGRINECVLFTLAESLGVGPDRVSHIVGAVPIAPATRGVASYVGADDFIHYAGVAQVTLHPAGTASLATLAHQLTFASTPLYGRRFTEVLEQAGGVFEAIPGVTDLNKVAHVTLVDGVNGETFSAGAVEETRLRDWLHAPRSERQEMP